MTIDKYKMLRNLNRKLIQVDTFTDTDDKYITIKTSDLQLALGQLDDAISEVFDYVLGSSLNKEKESND